MTENKKQTNAGGAWQKTDKNGNPYFFIKIDNKSYNAFKNTFKKDGEKTPDFYLKEINSKNLESNQNKQQQISDILNKQKPKADHPAFLDDSDIPF